MTIQPSPYDLVRAIQDQQRATDRLVQMLVGMLDKSGPEPLLTFPPPQAPAPAQAKPSAPTKKLRRVEGPAGRPPAVLKLGSVDVQTTERRAAILRAFIAQPRTLAAMVEAGFAPNTNAMMRQVVDINRDLQFASSVFRIKPDARPPREGGRGSVAPTYYLEGCVDDIARAEPGKLTTTPDDSSAAQSEAAPCAIPEQGADASAAGDGEPFTAQSAQFVTPPGEGEGGPAPADPSPAADQPIPELATVAAAVAEARPPEVETPPQPPADDASPSKGERVLDMWANTNFTARLIAEKAGCALSSVSAFVSIARKAGDARADARTPEALAARRAAEERVQPTQAEPVVPASPIEPGDLIAVDVKLRRVSVGRSGGYETSSVQMARTLDMLKGGAMFGLDKIATKAGWQSAEVARNALLLERNRLTHRGVDLYLDKFNARLREAQ